MSFRGGTETFQVKLAIIRSKKEEPLQCLIEGLAGCEDPKVNFSALDKKGSSAGCEAELRRLRSVTIE